MICLFPRQTIQYHGYSSLCPNQKCWRCWSWVVLWRPTRPFRTNTQKRCPFQFRELEWKSSNRPGVTGKFGLGVKNEAGQRPTEFCQENTLVIANTLLQQHKRRLYTWTSPDGQCWNQIDYLLCSQRCFIQSAETRHGADCGSDQELLIAKFRLKLKKVGKTTRPLRYDLNQIPFDYTVEVTNRFKGFDLTESWGIIDRGLWHCTRGNNQDHPQEKEMQKGKMVLWADLINSRGKKKEA